MRSFPVEPRFLGLVFILPLLLIAPGCADRDLAEEHVKLFLRIEHLPPGQARADEEIVLGAIIESSLDGSKLEAWVRIVDEASPDERVRLQIAEGGVASATIPGRARGEVLRYVIEARDAAGLVVALPQGADEGKAYSLRFVGESSRILGAISFLSALFAVILFIGAGAAAVQNLRGRMSAGPAGMLGGFGVVLVVVGLLLIGAIHARQVTGHLWPDAPLMLALSRGDLALISLVWAGNLFVGRRLLLDEEPEGAPRGERVFAGLAAILAFMAIIALLF